MNRLVASVLFWAALAPALAQDVAPDLLVKNVTQEVVALIAKDKEIKAGDRAKLVEVIEDKVLPHFNFAAMTALAMGQNWGKANPEQKKQLTEEFKTLLVRTYASALAAYSEQKFDFRPLRAKPTDTDVTVNVRVLQPGAQAVTIDYSMEKTGSGWKVYDVMVGGVSLVANYRTEFANTVRNSSIDGLIKELRAKNQPSNKQGEEVIRREGRRIVVSGRVTLANVAKLLEEGRQHLAEGAAAVDLGEVTEMDSALLALSLAWLREARAAKRELTFMNPPEALQTLSRLYGVETLLPLSA